MHIILDFGFGFGYDCCLWTTSLLASLVKNYVDFPLSLSQKLYNIAYDPYIWFVMDAYCAYFDLWDRHACLSFFFICTRSCLVPTPNNASIIRILLFASVSQAIVFVVPVQYPKNNHKACSIISIYLNDLINLSPMRNFLNSWTKVQFWLLCASDSHVAGY